MSYGFLPVPFDVYICVCFLRYHRPATHNQIRSLKWTSQSRILVTPHLIICLSFWFSRVIIVFLVPSYKKAFFTSLFYSCSHFHSTNLYFKTSYYTSMLLYCFEKIYEPIISPQKPFLMYLRALNIFFTANVEKDFFDWHEISSKYSCGTYVHLQIQIISHNQKNLETARFYPGSATTLFSTLPKLLLHSDKIESWDNAELLLKSLFNVLLLW